MSFQEYIETIYLPYLAEKKKLSMHWIKTPPEHKNNHAYANTHAYV